MQEAVHTEELRGYKIEIIPDTNPQNPREDCDSPFEMVCVHRRYQLGDQQFNNASSAINYLWDQLADPLPDGGYTQERLNELPILWLPLYLYDHSGITMNTTGFSDPWDSVQVGYIYITRKKAESEWPRTTDETKEDWDERIRGYMRNEVKVYDYYLRNEVYGYTISRRVAEAGSMHYEDDEWEQIDSCWGYYGTEDAIEAAKEAVPDKPYEPSPPAEPKNTIVMVFHEDGTVEFTRSPLLYNFFEGRGQMERISEICKEEHGTRYYIVWLKGKWAGVAHTRSLARNYLTPDEILHTLPVRMGGEQAAMHDPILTFATYEEAVLHEVQVLNAMRRAGETFIDKSST